MSKFSPGPDGVCTHCKSALRDHGKVGDPFECIPAFLIGDQRVFDKVQDSGERRDFVTGSRRDVAKGKGRFDLIPEMPMQMLAVHYENGAAKYGDRNWEKGQPLSVFLSSARRHWGKVLLNMQDEDHASACVWNMMGYTWTRAEIEAGRLPAELDDLGHTSKSKH